MLTALTLAMALLATAEGRNVVLQDDALNPTAFGPWRMACTRDAPVDGVAHMEVCNAKLMVDGRILSFSRTAGWLRTQISARDCFQHNLVKLPAARIAADQPARVIALNEALLRSLARGGSKCAAPGVFRAQIKAEDLQRMLDASEGLSGVDGAGLE